MLKQCIIIGGGPAGVAAAHAAVDSGLSSVVVVERDAFGGTCTNRGCIPTKFLLARCGPLRQSGAGMPPEEWRRTLQQKTALTRGLARSIEERLKGRGIAVLPGRGSLLSDHEVEVLAEGGGREVLEGERFVIATGSRPAELRDVSFDGSVVVSSNDALEFERPPRSLAIVGSGPVGAEFAFLYARLGVSVTLVEGASRLFPAEEPEVDSVFRKAYPRLGVRVLTGDPVAKVEVRSGGAGAVVLLESGAAIEAEKVLVGIGRGLESRGLGCERAGIQLGRRGEVVVDHLLRTSRPHIFAAGDVTGRMLLAHAATAMGELAGRAAAGAVPAGAGIPYHSIPWATFTDPEVGGVGLSVERAAAAGLDVVAGSAQLVDNVKARIDRAAEGFVKLVAERKTGRILGGTIVGPHASELIHIVALAVHREVSLNELKDFVFAHPSVAESIADAAQSCRSKQ